MGIRRDKMTRKSVERESETKAEERMEGEHKTVGRGSEIVGRKVEQGAEEQEIVQQWRK